MKNIKIQVIGDRLTIECDLSQVYGPSKSKKSVIVASTEGNASVPGHEDLKLGVNLYRLVE